MSFMDAFSGYIQILMHRDDQEKNSFIRTEAHRAEERRRILPTIAQ